MRPAALPRGAPTDCTAGTWDPVRGLFASGHGENRSGRPGRQTPCSTPGRILELVACPGVKRSGVAVDPCDPPFAFGGRRVRVCWGPAGPIVQEQVLSCHTESCCSACSSSSPAGCSPPTRRRRCSGGSTDRSSPRSASRSSPDRVRRLLPETRSAGPCRSSRTDGRPSSVASARTGTSSRPRATSFPWGRTRKSCSSTR